VASGIKQRPPGKGKKRPECEPKEKETHKRLTTGRGQRDEATWRHFTYKTISERKSCAKQRGEGKTPARAQKKKKLGGDAVCPGGLLYA